MIKKKTHTNGLQKYCITVSPLEGDSVPCYARRAKPLSVQMDPES